MQKPCCKEIALINDKGEMNMLTPQDIRQQQFRVKFRGFNVREVDAFLEQMAESFDTLNRENDNYNVEIQRLKREIQAFKKREETLKQATLNSQIVFEQMKENARKTGELTVSEAEVTAERIINRAHSRLAQLHEDIAELKRQRMQIKIQIRSIIESHSKLLDMGEEDTLKMEEEDTKLKLFKPFK
jgi:cell division initiation protein